MKGYTFKYTIHLKSANNHLGAFQDKINSPMMLEIDNSCQDHQIIKKTWFGRHLLWVGLPPTRTGCLWPHPAWSWTSRGMGHPLLSGQPVPHHPLYEEFPPNINFTYFRFKAILPFTVTIRPCRELVSFLFISSL